MHNVPIMEVLNSLADTTDMLASWHLTQGLTLESLIQVLS